MTAHSWYPWHRVSAVAAGGTRPRPDRTLARRPSAHPWCGLGGARLTVVVTLALGCLSGWWGVAAAAPVVAPPGVPSGAPEKAVPAQEVELVARVIELTNAERQKAGLRALVPHPALARSAQGYAEVLVGGDCFAHDCGPVPQLRRRIELAGYSGWRDIAENIAAGQPTAERVVEGWMRSEGHRTNILNPAYAEIGVGLARGGKWGLYWVQNFGARSETAATSTTVPAPTAVPGPTMVPAAPVAPAADVPTAPVPILAAQTGGCAFQLGFAALRSRLGAAVVGSCLEDEWFNPANGNAEQRASGGLLVWRKADNWTAFTDGYRTWVHGPAGVQVRLNAQRFAWEADPLGA